MYEIILSAEFKENFEKLPKHIKKKFLRRIKIFFDNPFHPILRTEKLNPPFQNEYSFRIDSDYRVIFAFIKERKILFITCGHHNWIYKLPK